MSDPTTQERLKDIVDALGWSMTKSSEPEFDFVIVRTDEPTHPMRVAVRQFPAVNPITELVSFTQAFAFPTQEFERFLVQIQMESLWRGVTVTPAGVLRHPHHGQEYEGRSFSRAISSQSLHEMELILAVAMLESSIQKAGELCGTHGLPLKIRESGTS